MDPTSSSASTCPLIAQGNVPTTMIRHRPSNFSRTSLDAQTAESAEWLLLMVDSQSPRAGQATCLTDPRLYAVTVEHYF